MDSPSSASRREFLKAGAALGGGLVIGVFVPGVARYAEAATGEAPLAPNAWIRIGTDDIVTVIVDKSEMGQGVYTALPMLVAEELDANWSRVRWRAAPAAPAYKHPWFGVQGTGGSTSVRAMWQPLRHAGAAARAMLIAAAAETWKVDAATLKTENGRVIGARGKQASYGELAARAATLPLPEDVKLKDPKDFRIIGKATRRLDTPDKVNGAARFGIDTAMPGLLTALVARSPVVGGKVAGFKAGAALAVKGVKQVLPVKSPTAEGIAVLADGFWAARQGRDALEIQWDNGAHAALSIATMRQEMRALAVSGQDALTAKQHGDIAAVKAAKTVEAIYEAPYLAHAPMEPMNCAAWVKPDGVEIWVGSQAQGPNQMTAARIAGVAPEQVRIHTLLLGGGFGRRFAPDFVVEAVELSKAAQAGQGGLHARGRYPRLLLSPDGGMQARRRPG
jgi:isoquinoline 1-oxidoreductase beta subunit